MHPTSSAQKENILSLASHGHGHSTHTIASRLGLSQSTVSRILRTLHPNQPCSSGGRPPKLSSRDQHAILSQIAIGRAANATQVTKHINTIIPHPVSSETVRRVLRKHSFKAVVKKKKPFLSARHRELR